MVNWEEKDMSLDVMSSETQLYERSFERYKDLLNTDCPTDDKFMEVYEELKGCLYQANVHLFKLDELAERRFKDHLKTQDFDRLRRAIDKGASRLQRAIERTRETGYFIRKMLSEYS